MKIFRSLTTQKIVFMTFFAATDDEFDLIFPEGTDIAFIDEVYGRSDEHRWMLPQVCCIDGLNPQAIAVIGAGNLGFPKHYSVRPKTFYPYMKIGGM